MYLPYSLIRYYPVTIHIHAPHLKSQELNRHLIVEHGKYSLVQNISTVMELNDIWLANTLIVMGFAKDNIMLPLVDLMSFVHLFKILVLTNTSLINNFIL